MKQNDAQVIALEQCYLSTVIAVINADQLDVLQQDFGQGAGRLWATTKGTTVPVLHVAYRFDVDDVQFQVQTRNERSFTRSVKYAEGIDAFIEELQKFLRAGRLAHKRAA